MDVFYEETQFGFRYGNAVVDRICSDTKKGWVVLGIFTDKYKEGKKGMIEVYVTKTGKVRIRADGKEWLPVA